jgi:hypothetical protein
MTNPTGTGMNFYPWVRVRVQISTRNLFAGGRVIALSDPLPSLIVMWGISYTRHKKPTATEPAEVAQADALA